MACAYSFAITCPNDGIDFNKFSSVTNVQDVKVGDVIKKGVKNFQPGRYEYNLYYYNSKSKKAMIDDEGVLRHTLKRLKKDVKKDASFLENVQWPEPGCNGTLCFEVSYSKVWGFSRFFGQRRVFVEWKETYCARSCGSSRINLLLHRWPNL